MTTRWHVFADADTGYSLNTTTGVRHKLKNIGNPTATTPRAHIGRPATTWHLPGGILKMTKLQPRCLRPLLIISVLAIATTAIAASPPAPTLTGKVVGIANGDTLTPLANKIQVKVRLEGIDTPERAQPFGRKAGQALAKKVFGKVVQVDDLGKDRYRRTLGIVRLDTRNVNLELVREGWAWWYRKYAPKNKELATAEAAARKARRGLWADAKPIPPCDWRQSERERRQTNRTVSHVDTGYWLNTSTGVRHNRNCRNFRSTKRGRACGADEGKACGICGG